MSATALDFIFGFDDSRRRKQVRFTAEHERVLRETPIDESGPGTVVRDFDALLDFVGPTGVEAGGKHHMFPMAALAALNARLVRPVDLRLARPQLRSYPNLQALQLLGRATGLLAVSGAGEKARLVVDESLLAIWRGLNPAERYFTMLEAMLFHAEPEMIGERGKGIYSMEAGFLSLAIEIWGRTPAKRKTYPAPTSKHNYAGGCFDPDRYVLALLDLFGFARAEQGKAINGIGWWLGAAERLPFGEAMFAWLLDPDSVEVVFGDEDEVNEADDERTPVILGDPGKRFDRLRPILVEFFPGWQNVFVVPGAPFQEGTHTFKVSLGRGRDAVWWRIAMEAATTLETLSSVILKCAKFDNDHLYQFTYKGRSGKDVEVMTPDGDTEGAYTTEVRVGDVPLEPGESMTYLFDFGDDWEFDVRLEQIDPPDPKRKPLKTPKVLEKHGKPPKQYGDEWY